MPAICYDGQCNSIVPYHISNIVVRIVRNVKRRYLKFPYLCSYPFLYIANKRLMYLLLYKPVVEDSCMNRPCCVDRKIILRAY